MLSLALLGLATALTGMSEKRAIITDHTDTDHDAVSGLRDEQESFAQEVMNASTTPQADFMCMWNRGITSVQRHSSPEPDQCSSFSATESPLSVAAGLCRPWTRNTGTSLSSRWSALKAAAGVTTSYTQGLADANFPQVMNSPTRCGSADGCQDAWVNCQAELDQIGQYLGLPGNAPGAATTAIGTHRRREHNGVGFTSRTTGRMVTTNDCKLHCAMQDYARGFLVTIVRNAPNFGVGWHDGDGCCRENLDALNGLAPSNTCTNPQNILAANLPTNAVSLPSGSGYNRDPSWTFYETHPQGLTGGSHAPFQVVFDYGATDWRTTGARVRAVGNEFVAGSTCFEVKQSSDGSSWTSVGSYTVASNNAWETHDFSSEVTARYMQFNLPCPDNYGANNPGRPGSNHFNIFWHANFVGCTGTLVTPSPTPAPTAAPTHAPVNCAVGSYGDWSACSASCATGSQSRSRSVTTHAAHGGAACPALTESRSCNTHNCPVDCVVNEYGAWSTCTRSCGHGTQTRTRTVQTPRAHNGAVCPALEETTPCNTHHCPVDCIVSGFGAWSTCSQTCGTGSQSRTRTVTQSMAHGGAACPSLQESRTCNPQICDRDGDGVADSADGCPDDAEKTAVGACGCGTADTDSDSDGTPNCNDGCPNDASKTAPGTCGCGTPDADSDGDGTLDCQDQCPNDASKTAPGQCGCGTAETDTDGDGTPDCNDQCPNNRDKRNRGRCGCNAADGDTDGDGIHDCNDECPNDASKTAPGTCGCGTPDTDSDSDGTPDCNDQCPNDATKQAPGTCGCGVSDVDGDSDGTPDCNDQCSTDANKQAPGTCGCGQSDVDGDGDSTPDCNDQCSTDPLKTEPGACGCGVADTDANSNGTPDCLDPAGCTDKKVRKKCAKELKKFNKKCPAGSGSKKCKKLKKKGNKKCKDHACAGFPIA